MDGTNCICRQNRVLRQSKTARFTLENWKNRNLTVFHVLLGAGHPLLQSVGGHGRGHRFGHNSQFLHGPATTGTCASAVVSGRRVHILAVATAVVKFTTSISGTRT